MKLEWTPENNLVIPYEKWLQMTRLPVKTSKKEIEFKSGRKMIFTYTSWTCARALLKEHFPDLEVGFEHYDGVPFLIIPAGVLIGAYLFNTKGQRTTPEYYAVRDQRLDSPVEPDLGLITNNMQRAMVRVIAIQLGIGWSVYADDDHASPPAPQEEDAPPRERKPAPVPAGKKLYTPGEPW